MKYLLALLFPIFLINCSDETNSLTAINDLTGTWKIVVGNDTITEHIVVGTHTLTVNNILYTGQYQGLRFSGTADNENNGSIIEYASVYTLKSKNELSGDTHATITANGYTSTSVIAFTGKRQ